MSHLIHLRRPHDARTPKMWLAQCSGHFCSADKRWGQIKPLLPRGVEASRRPGCPKMPFQSNIRDLLEKLVVFQVSEDIEAHRYVCLGCPSRTGRTHRDSPNPA